MARFYINCYENNVLIVMFKSMQDASRILNISYDYIHMCLYENYCDSTQKFYFKHSDILVRRPKQNKTFVCKGCGIEFSAFCYQHMPRLYCTQTCRLKYEHAHGRKLGFDPHKSNYFYWLQKGGKEYADKREKEVSKIKSIAMQNADMTYQKEIARQKRIDLNKSHIGKTNIEIYGEEKAQAIHDKHSLSSSGENNPAFGKVYTNGGKSLKGYYKKIFFRSLLEYSFIKHLESQKIDIYNDVDYECFKVPYMNEKGTNRTYRIDFYVKSQQVVYEVKPSYIIDIIPPNQQLKWEAAKKFFDEKYIEFRIVTEKDFKKISFNEALLDKDIEWNKKTFEYFKTNKETQKLIDELNDVEKLDI